MFPNPASEFFSRFARERRFCRHAWADRRITRRSCIFKPSRRHRRVSPRARPALVQRSFGEDRRGIARSLLPSRRRRRRWRAGANVPFSFYFLFIRRAARPGENGLTVSPVDARGEPTEGKEIRRMNYRSFWSGKGDSERSGLTAGSGKKKRKVSVVAVGWVIEEASRNGP